MATGRSKRFTEADIAEWTAALDAMEPQDVLRWGVERFGRRMAIATSFQTDGMVIIDMASRIDPGIRVTTVDTGRLPQQTYDLMERVGERYRIAIEVYYPDAPELEAFVTREGVNAFYRSVEHRTRCCEIRKVVPLRKALRTLDAWVCGLRRDQWFTRSDLRKLELDHVHGDILKVNPLADWTEEQVWDYIRAHDVLYNGLYDEGYTSIGCAPCTRPVGPGEDRRAGRWWWEKEARKECGIHRRH